MNSYLANKLGALATALADRLDSAAPERSRSAVAVLLTLLHRGPMTGTGLAHILRIAQPTSTRVVQGLVRDGLVERADRSGREVDLRLTPAGRTEAERLQEARLRAMDALLSALAEDERHGLDALASRVLAAATGGRADARHICRFCRHDICMGPDCPVGSRATEIERRDPCHADRP